MENETVSFNQISWVSHACGVNKRCVEGSWIGESEIQNGIGFGGLDLGIMKIYVESTEQVVSLDKSMKSIRKEVEMHHCLNER